MKSDNDRLLAMPRTHINRAYLTLQEAADLAGVSKKRMQNLMGEGVLRENVHFSRPRGLRVRFIREALTDWLEGKDKDVIASVMEETAGSRRSNLNPALMRNQSHGL